MQTELSPEISHHPTQLIAPVECPFMNLKII